MTLPGNASLVHESLLAHLNTHLLIFLVWICLHCISCPCVMVTLSCSTSITLSCSASITTRAQHKLEKPKQHFLLWITNKSQANLSIVLPFSFIPHSKVIYLSNSSFVPHSKFHLSLSLSIYLSIWKWCVVVIKEDV